jgi:hypothetical protein
LTYADILTVSVLELVPVVVRVCRVDSVGRESRLRKPITEGVHSLGVSGELRKSLASTDLIESLFSVVRKKMYRVKNWKAQRSNQILR